MQVAAADLRVGDKVITLEPGGSFCRTVTVLETSLEPHHDVTVWLAPLSLDADAGMVCTVPADAQITVQR